MASAALYSPAELDYIHSSLALQPPIRPDGRSPTQFRPLVAETDVLPNANGSARLCFADGGEAVVGVKAEVEKSDTQPGRQQDDSNVDISMDNGNDQVHQGTSGRGKGQNSWVEISVDVPGYREDDALPVFLCGVLGEALTASSTLKDRLWINRRFHWKLYVDILLLSPPLSYPLQLLSLTMHLALLASRLPRLVSEGDEDPLFDDDWEASTFLYPDHKGTKSRVDRPPVTLLAATVGDNVLFDPSMEEVAAADGIVAVSAGESADQATPPKTTQISRSNDDGGVRLDQASAGTAPPRAQRRLELLAARMVDPPARSTPLGAPNALNSAVGGTAPASTLEMLAARERMQVGSSGDDGAGVWTPPKGGITRATFGRVVDAALRAGGVGEEMMAAMDAFSAYVKGGEGTFE